MNVIYDAGGYESPQMRQILMSGACWRTVVEALHTLKFQQEFAYQFVAKVVCGIYIFHNKEKDAIYFVAEQAAKVDKPEIKVMDRLVMVDVLSAESELAIRSRVDELCADESKEFPPIFDEELHITEAYIEFVVGLDFAISPGDLHSERPLRLFGKCDEVEALSRLQRGNDSMARKLLPFIVYKRDETGPWAVVCDSAIVGGGRFDEDQFELDRQLLPVPLKNWRRARRGTVGIILTMEHPDWGRHTYGLTSAHVVFQELLNVTEVQCQQFNSAVSYAHYSRTLDFCLLELRPAVTRVQNIVSRRLSPTLLNATHFHEGMKVIKFGCRSNLTSGDLIDIERASGVARGMVLVGSTQQFAMPGDSGSVYLLCREQSDTLVPFALHKGSCPRTAPSSSAGLRHLHVGCSLISCLKKFVWKTKNVNATTSQILSWFRVAQNVG